MARVTKVLRQCVKAAEDMELLKALQSEIKYELSSNRFQNDKTGPLGDFVIDWDSPQSKDVVLRKKFESGEELAVSALLDHETYEVDKRFPMECLMKVCIKKPGLSSILQFDCGVSGKGEKGSEFAIQNAYYLPSSTSLGPSVYKGPIFSTLDPNLQDELKQSLVSRGIGESFTNFLLLHLHKKEQDHYVNWLQNLKSVVGAQNDN